MYVYMHMYIHVHHAPQPADVQLYKYNVHIQADVIRVLIFYQGPICQSDGAADLQKYCRAA